MKSKMITETPQKALLSFSLPLLAGSIFQNLYNVFDTMIVGQMLGKEALSAVGNSYVPMLIVNSVLLGVSSGISILVSQSYGSQRQTETQECIGSVHAITIIVGIGLSIIALVNGRWLFKAMSIPENILSFAIDYWKITAIGIPFSSICNFYSAIKLTAMRQPAFRQRISVRLMRSFRHGRSHETQRRNYGQAAFVAACQGVK